MRRPVRVLLALPLLVAGIGAISTAARIGPAAPLCAQAASPHRVGLVVEHGDGQVVRRCVGFDTPDCDGARCRCRPAGSRWGSRRTEVVSARRSARSTTSRRPIRPAASPPPVCTGCCSCRMPAAHGSTRTLGASNLSVTNGDDIGFRYDSQTGADPPPASPAGTCPVVTPPPTPTRTPAPSGRSTPAQRTPPSSSGDLGGATPGDAGCVDDADLRDPRGRDPRRHRGAVGLPALAA